ncbi:LPS export ABC transporter periplasmic protein LptC [Noviherbaspirillum suwonense]|jgi:lipopolysaccharide export system protein LptC|uniref:Lipopolysaccharide export system protein LptC n=1 Tax=Noviherbaspirillum suwonense TaxID=1224511 RepID=A0ABY1Q2D7_9BURK|nr:LPS export ABC transporter periplasmic protein LptC [Noviherbaspirillum suwonense]SMP53134.1 lipopolysaccharide export system protein LptC [Noviherbaspirillum suwonense]
MKKDRRRFGALPLLMLAVVLALGSFWLLEIMRKTGNAAGTATARVDPDYFVENFNFVRLSATGEAQYNISGKRMVHNPADDTHTVDLPVVNSLSRERPPMTARAERAWIEPDGSRVHMYDQVRIDRPKTPASTLFHMESDYLLVLPDEDIMRTDKPVRMTLGDSQLNGTGMVANNATGEVQLASRVQATLPPKNAAP